MPSKTSDPLHVEQHSGRTRRVHLILQAKNRNYLFFASKVFKQALRHLLHFVFEQLGIQILGDTGLKDLLDISREVCEEAPSEEFLRKGTESWFSKS